MSFLPQIWSHFGIYAITHRHRANSFIYLSSSFCGIFLHKPQIILSVTFIPSEINLWIFKKMSMFFCPLKKLIYVDKITTLILSVSFSSFVFCFSSLFPWLLICLRLKLRNPGLISNYDASHECGVKIYINQHDPFAVLEKISFIRTKYSPKSNDDIRVTSLLHF